MSCARHAVGVGRQEETSMSDDNNVIDLESRAAQAKAMHTGYLIKDLEDSTLKGSSTRRS